MAKHFTALGVSFLPRPAGLSGWVYTPTMLWSVLSKAAKWSAANSGVPAKTIFNDVLNFVP